MKPPNKVQFGAVLVPGQDGRGTTKYTKPDDLTEASEHNAESRSQRSESRGPGKQRPDRRSTISVLLGGNSPALCSLRSPWLSSCG